MRNILICLNGSEIDRDYSMSVLIVSHKIIFLQINLQINIGPRTNRDLIGIKCASALYSTGLGNWVCILSLLYR